MAEFDRLSVSLPL